MRWLLLAGPVVLVVGRLIPEERRWLRLGALAFGGAATAVGAWRAYSRRVGWVS